MNYYVINLLVHEFDGEDFPGLSDGIGFGCNKCSKFMSLNRFYHCKTCSDGKIDCVMSYELCDKSILKRNGVGKTHNGTSQTDVW